MAGTSEAVLPSDDELLEATLIFREQADGRRVARLPQGKVVLVAAAEADRVKNGEQWRVRLRQRDTFAIADLVERVPLPAINPVLSPDQAKLIQTKPVAEPASKTPIPSKGSSVVTPLPAQGTEVSKPSAVTPMPAAIRI